MAVPRYLVGGGCRSSSSSSSSSSCMRAAVGILSQHGLHLASTSPSPASLSLSLSLLHNKNNKRHFSVAAAVETTIHTTQHLFTELHLVTHTPWFITIPLIAVSLNLLTRLPLTVYARKVAQRRVALTPLLQAWVAKHALAVQAMKLPTEAAHNKELDKRFKRTTKRVYRDFAVQTWKNYSSFAVFPVWLVGIESLRRLCSGPQGLLGTIFFNRNAAAAAAGTETVGADASTSLEAVSATATDTNSLVPLQELSTLFEGADPSLATGGCLWFPDLMVEDPLHVLPIMLSAVLVINIMPRTGPALRRFMGVLPQAGAAPAAPATMNLRIHRLLLLVALAIGPATMHLPAALHLYWIASSATTLLITEGIGKFMPLPKYNISRPKGVSSTLIRPTRLQDKV